MFDKFHNSHDRNPIYPTCSDVKLDDQCYDKFASWQLLDTLIQISDVHSCVQFHLNCNKKRCTYKFSKQFVEDVV